MKKFPIDPDNDGLDHIRISRHAKTRLGRLLVHSAITPFTVQGRGEFKSLDGFRLDCLFGSEAGINVHEISGLMAEKLILQSAHVNDANYSDLFRVGFLDKLEQTRPGSEESHLPMSLADLVALNTLPFFLYEVEEQEVFEEDMPEWMTAVLCAQREHRRLKRSSKRA